MQVESSFLNFKRNNITTNTVYFPVLDGKSDTFFYSPSNKNPNLVSSSAPAGG